MQTVGTSVVKFVSGFVMLVVLLAVGGGLLAACGDNLRVGISIDPHAVSLPVGVSSNIVVTTDGATGDAPVFKADHPDIASVSYGHGTLTVTGVAVGTTRVSATFHGEVVDVDVTVTDAQLVGLALNTAALTLPIGLDGPLTVVARYTDGSQVDVTSQVTFSVDDGAIGKIDHGAFHALKAGATVGHAAFRGLTADFSITVTAAILTALEVAPIEPRLAVGLAVDLAATGLFSDGSALDLTTAVTWSSADPTTASVSATGRALASKPGTVDITAAVGEIHGVAHLTVTGAHVSGLAIAPATATIPVTSNLELHASAALDDGTAADVTTQVTWQSSDPAIVTIDARGNAHGVALGSATISADLGTLGHATASVTVTGAVLQAITITPDPLTLPALVIGHLTATGTFSDGVPRDVTAQAVWTSDAPITATVVGGVVVGLVPGTATVHAKVGGLTGDGVVHVTSAVLQTITVTSPTPTLPIGTTTQLAARATFSDGSTFDVTSQAVWSSSHGDRIAVSNAGARGLATAIGAGGSTITARLAGVAGALDLTATTATLTQIDLSPATVTLPVGSTQKLTATGRFSDGTILDLTAQATWTSSAPAIAAVASDGTVTGAAAGDATITARVGAIAGTRTVHVTSALLMAIQVTPAAVSVPAGLTTPLAAIARFSDGSTLDVTATAMWTSSAPAIATVSNAAGSRGVVTGKAAGSATITAALDGQTASSTVTVSAATLTEIQLTPAVLDLPVGTTGTLVATGVFSDGATVDLTSQVAFTSSNAGVATVSAGAVAGVAPGSATITATLAGVSATATVHVGGAALTAITIDPPTATVPLLATTQLTATGVFSDASTLDVTAQATWASSNPLVAAVSNAAGTRGQVTGLLPGSATISATINGVSATATITVTAALLTGIQVSPAALHLPAGLSAPLSVIGTFSDGSTADITTQATFASNDPATATVSAGGAVLAVTPGAATITAAVGLATATATINVTAASLQQVVVNPGVLNLPSGTTGQLTAVGVFSDGSHQDLTAIATWTSSAPTTAAASNVAGAQGKVTASSVGTATITATIGGGSSTVAGSATVTVTSATITGLAIDPTNPQVPLLGTAQLTATATFSDGTTRDVTPQATWSSANPLVAAVSNAAGTRGKLSALLPGTAQITATFNGQSATTLATVTLAVLVSTEITPSSLSLPAGHTGAVQVVGHYSDGSTQDLTAQATFSSSNPAVASIASGGAGGSAGVVTANAPGAATISATIGLVSATASVTVSAATLQAVAIAPATLTLPLGQTGALTATGTFSDGTTADVTQTATWTTSAPLVAGVGNLALAGKVIALVPGTATITATIGTTTATATVTVTAATLASVAVTPGAPSVAIGGTAQLSATGTFSDGTTADVTAQTTFTSSNPGVVSVSNAAGTRGKITGVALGTATITATDGGSTTSVTVSVTPATLISAAIDAGTGSVAAGTTLALGVIGTFSDGTTADLTAQASFASSAPTVATVSAAGVVTGVATGDATITATVAGVTATAVVHVGTAALTQIQISPAALALPRGTSAPLTAVGVFSDGSHVDLTPQVTWSSSAPATASVSATGAVTAVATGAATITASLDGKTASVPVTVSAAAIASLAIDPPSPTVALLQTVALTATGTFSDGSTLDVSQQAIWTSSDPLTALVSNLDGARGRVTGLVAGTATITATVGSASASVTITVTPAVLVSAAIQPAALTLPSGLSAPLAVIGTFSDGTTADLTAQATFSSTDPIVAAVASDGLVTAGAAGTATVTAHVGTVNASVVVSSVAASLQQLQVTPTQLGLPRGTTAQLAAVGVFSDGSHQDVTTLVTWTTSAPAIASVGNLITAGKVTAIAVGTATLTATLGTTHTDVPVTVSAASLGSLAIDPPAPAVGLGQTTQLTATGTFSDSSTADVSQQATWTSSNPLVAAVSNVDGTRGKVTGLLAGSATITATIGAATASVAVTVSPATLVAATISPAVLALPNGLAQQVAVTGLFSDGTTHDVTAQAVFSSSTPAIASVSTTGTVTARAPGAALITVAIGGVTAALPVTVTPAVLQQVQVAPSVLSLPRGTAAPLTATGVFSDGSHADITGLVTWTSSATAVASVSNVLLSAGRVTGNAVGDATISATLAGVAGTAAVHVGNATLTSIAVSGADVLVPIGLTQQLTATGTFSDGTTADVTAQATWASDSAVVVVSNVAGARGLATAVAIGSATVTATVGTVSGSTTVGTTGASLLSIDIPSVPALPLGLTAQLTASGHFSDGSVVDVTGQVAWSSTSPTIGAVSATGVVSAFGLGTATVQASLGGVTGTQTIGISAAVLQVLVVTPAVVSLPVGLGQGLIATATFSDGSLVDVTTQVTWSSDHSNVAAVTNVGAQGVVTAIAPGTATITAQKGTITAHAAVIVTPAVLTSITVNSGQAASIALGQIAQLTATGNFSDGTTADLTSQVAWTSSAPTALAISNLPGSQGRVTALAAGAATITATSALTGVAGATGVSVAAGCHVVINELKTGAVLSTSDEFIELFNPCSFDVDLSHESLVYRTLAGVIDITLNTLTGTLPAGGYRVYGGTAYGGSVSGTFSTDLPALGGGIAVRDANVIYDSLGYGIAVNLFVEGAVSLQVPAGQTLARIPNGRDTNNNAADFQIRTPTPGAANQ